MSSNYQYAPTHSPSSKNYQKHQPKQSDNPPHHYSKQVIYLPYTFQQYVYFHSDKPTITKSVANLQFDSPNIHNQNKKYTHSHQSIKQPTPSFQSSQKSQRKLSKPYIEEQYLDEIRIKKTISKQSNNNQQPIYQPLQLYRSKTQVDNFNRSPTPQFKTIQQQKIQSSNIKSSKLKSTKSSIKQSIKQQAIKCPQSIKYYAKQSKIESKILSKGIFKDINDPQQYIGQMICELKKIKSKRFLQLQDNNQQVMASKMSTQQSPWNISYRL